MRLQHLLLTAAGLVGWASAQVTSDCNPTEGDDCDPNPALGTSQFFKFNESQKFELWETQVGPVHYEGEDGARLTIAKQGDSPTLRTKFYIFFGRVELVMKAAHGQGIVSSMMLLSDNLDEIDWEIIGGNTTHASTNFFGKDVQNYENGAWHGMPVSPQDEYHNYTVDWSKEKMDFYIDDALVRTVNADEPQVNGTSIYPQTPSRLSLGIWAGGDPSLNEWTREWAGGDTDFDAGPYDLFIKSVYIEDYHSGSEYIWGDESGSWESIEVVEGNSTALDAINEPPKTPEKSVSEKFEELPQGAKIAVYSGGGIAGAALIAGIIFYIIKQRSRGAAEAAEAAEDRDNFDGVGTEYRGAAGLGAYSAVNNGEVSNEKALGGTAATTPMDQPAPTWGGSGQTYESLRPADDPFADRPGSAYSELPPTLDVTDSRGPEQAYGAQRMQSYRD